MLQNIFQIYTMVFVSVVISTQRSLPSRCGNHEGWGNIYLIYHFRPGSWHSAWNLTDGQKSRSSHCHLLFGLLRLSITYGFCCSVIKSRQLWNPMNYSMPGLPVLHYLPEFARTHVHWVSDAIQPSHPPYDVKSISISFWKYFLTLNVEQTANYRLIISYISMFSFLFSRYNFKLFSITHY